MNELPFLFPTIDHKLTKRVACHCKGKSGTYWFGISECHDASSLQCYAFMGVCCVPHQLDWLHSMFTHPNDGWLYQKTRFKIVERLIKWN